MKAFVRGFVFAFNGIGIAVKGRNMRVHLVAATAVFALGFYVGLTASQWTTIVICIGLVISAEAMNTAVEELCNFITVEKNESIRKTKDIAAGAVLVVAIASAVVAAIIFTPHFF